MDLGEEYFQKLAEKVVNQFFEQLIMFYIGILFFLNSRSRGFICINSQFIAPLSFSYIYDTLFIGGDKLSQVCTQSDNEILYRNIYGKLNFPGANCVKKYFCNILI